MLDILLTRDGDLEISENGDIALTESIIQAIRIRLLWFFQEWRFAPRYGVPYYEEILIKNPNLARVRRIIRNEILSVEGVSSVKHITVNYDKPSRVAMISYAAMIDGEERREGVELNV